MERCSQCEARGGLGSRFFDVKIWGIGVCIGTRDGVHTENILHRPAIGMLY